MERSITESTFEKKSRVLNAAFLVILIIPYPGSVLLSHTVTRAVPSAMRGLTSVFGMGTGVTPSL